MAVLCWVVLVLAVFLSPQPSLAAVNQTWLTNIIEELKKEYQLGDSYSLAVNLPVNQDVNSLAEVLQDDPADAVKQAISTGQEYEGTRVVAAAQSEALTRVLVKIQPLITRSDGNVLIIYSEGYPYANGMVNEINNVVQNWKNYAFVFSKVAEVADADRAALFKQQPLSKFGLQNIFRCYGQSDSFQCTNCKSGDNVAPSCIENTNQPNGNEETEVGEPEPTSAGSNKGIISDSNVGPNTGSISVKQDSSVIFLGKGGKGGKGKKRRKCGKGGRMRKSCKRGKRGKKRKSRKRGKGGRMRKSRKRGKGGRMRKSRKRGKGGRMRKSRKRGKGGRMRKSRKRGKRGRMRKSRKRGKGGRMRKSRSRGKSGKRKGKRRG